MKAVKDTVAIGTDTEGSVGKKKGEKDQKGQAASKAASKAGGVAVEAYKAGDKEFKQPINEGGDVVGGERDHRRRRRRWSLTPQSFQLNNGLSAMNGADAVEEKRADTEKEGERQGEQVTAKGKGKAPDTVATVVIAMRAAVEVVATMSMPGLEPVMVEVNRADLEVRKGIYIWNLYTNW